MTDNEKGGEAIRLSARLRPDVEAAPWVIEEVTKLEKERDWLREQAKRLERLCTARAQIIIDMDNKLGALEGVSRTLQHRLKLLMHGDACWEKDES